MSLFSIIVITTFYFVLQPKVSLPIYSPSMVSEELVEEDIRYIKKYHKINDFVTYKSKWRINFTRILSK